MNRAARLLSGIMALAVLFLAANVSAQSDQPPYLYYFSPDLNAYVIERADGSQSRLIGQGLAAPDTNQAGGSWSPSGKYFAWKTSIWAGPGNVEPQAWIVSADGTERLTMLDNLRDVDQMEWSPIEDLLFVVDTHVNGAAGATYYLINVETRALITSFTLFNWQGGFYYSAFRWSPDGSHVVLFYDVTNQVNGEWPIRRFRRAVSRTGEIDDAPIGRTFGSIYHISPRFSASGDLAYLSADGEQLVVENIASKTTQTYDMPDVRYFYEIHWSAAGNYALLSSPGSCEPGTPCADLWLLTGTGLIQIAEQIDYQEYYPPELWAPTGDLAQFVTVDGVLHLLNPATLEIVPVSGIENVGGAAWSADGRRLLVVLAETDAPIYLYNIETETSTPLDAVQLYGSIEQIVSSPDSRYFAVGRSFAILNVRERRFSVLRTHEEAMIGYYSWHPSSEWLICNQMLYRAGGGIGPLFSSVGRSDGSQQRDLSLGFYHAAWLPENVIPHLSAE